MAPVKTIIGLMSGTSMDGIDAAVLRTDGQSVAEPGAFVTIPYDHAFRARLRACMGEAAGERHIAAVEQELTDRHADAVAALLSRAGAAKGDIDLIGFHGQTILHAPCRRLTRQIGDGARLAAATGIPVISDFRRADVEAGGQGAPLVPLYHRALATDLPRPLAILNIGGVANVTWIGADGALIACDTGPGNALIDDWILTRQGLRYDSGGRVAARGSVHAVALTALLDHPFFDRPAPKSLDRNAFNPSPVAGLSIEDGAATLTAFTAFSVERLLPHLPAPPARWVVTGGGRRNATLMAMLADRLRVPVDPVETVGWNGDALEAQAFAYLAARSRLGLPLSEPGTTGVPAPVTGGRYHAVG